MSRKNKIGFLILIVTFLTFDTAFSETAEEAKAKGIKYDDAGQYDMAIVEYNKAIELNPRLAPAYFERGSAYIKKSNFGLAISDFTKAIELNPNDAKAYIARGLAYHDKGNIDQAFSDFTKSIELNPNPIAYGGRAGVYYEKGNFDQAISDCTKAIELNPNLALSYYSRGLAYYAKEDYARAWGDVQKAESLGYKVDPDFLGMLETLKKGSEESGGEVPDWTKIDTTAEWGRWIKTVYGPYGGELFSTQMNNCFLIFTPTSEEYAKCYKALQNIRPPDELKAFHEKVLEQYSSSFEHNQTDVNKLRAEAKQELVRVLTQHSVPKNVIDDLTKEFSP